MHSEDNNRVYLALGSNIGNSVSIIRSAIGAIAHTHQVQLLTVSSLYRTTPVSPIPQSNFINAVCAISTALSPEALYDALHRIEILLGKTPKEKNAPRAIDIDILFFGMQYVYTSELIIPHPHWHERLFVLAPLAEIAKTITVPLNDQGICHTIYLNECLLAFANPHQERVVRLAD